MRIANTILVKAPIDRVWELTADVESWPSFNSTMRRVERLDEGPLRVGSSARIKQPAQPAAVWMVNRLDPGRGFSWSTRRMGLIMTGEHLLEPVGDSCRNTLSIELTGPVSGFLGFLFHGLFLLSLKTENAAFKKMAEQDRGGTRHDGSDTVERPDLRSTGG
ncbi:SRPBCC family protein [Streptomyces sp. RKAG293]|uniref:SRPBCC family protein n=1 Tax=Streptomyces sp. RKAG293 TaxID=2893403 RepID=UPI0020349BEA|nr:SRPBCC family protein [Streptomyces sp. RKAG293]MCM2416588.1 SRPBCC family protein [Streptomyces sp. RKAG293]